MTGIVESLTSESGRYLVAQGVLGVWALGATAAMVYLYLARNDGWKEARRVAEVAKTEAKEHYEKRLAEALSILTTMQANTTAMGKIAEGMQDRGTKTAESLSQVTTAITLLARDIDQWRSQDARDEENGQTYWKERMTQIERTIQEISSKVAALPYRVAGSS